MTSFASEGPVNREPLRSEGNALSPFTPDQEARLREIIRNEIDADNALRNSRDSAEFGEMLAREFSFRPALEAKRGSVAGVDVQRDGISVEIVTMPGGARRGVWRRGSSVMTHAEIDAYLRGNRKRARAGLVSHLTTALRRWASNSGVSNAR